MGVPDASFARRQNLRTFSHVRTSKIAFGLDMGSGWKFVRPGFRLKTNGLKPLGDPSKFSARVTHGGRVCEVTYKPGGTLGAKSDFNYELLLEARVRKPSPQEDHPAFLTIIIDPPGNNGMIPPGP